jgi:predicted CxxxxCH...CXXCH cytochrome family protein
VSKTSDQRAEVILGSRASSGGFAASYDKDSQACLAFCHSPAGTPKASPAWTAPLTALACTTCHDAPHKNPAYGGGDCAQCHQQTVARCTVGEAGCFEIESGVGVSFVSIPLHGDGKVELGAAGAESLCSGCHGTAKLNGAPGPDLNGGTSTSEVTVGLHEAHLSASLFGKAIPCESCHLVPTNIKDAGHLDSVSPAEIVFSDLANGKIRDPSVGLNPAWDRKTATCTNVYCHSLSGAMVTEWKWTQKQEQMTCFSCHGFPPQKTLLGGNHPQILTCGNCHAGAIVDGLPNPETHINGKVELGL